MKNRRPLAITAAILSFAYVVYFVATTEVTQYTNMIYYILNIISFTLIGIGLVSGKTIISGFGAIAQFGWAIYRISSVLNNFLERGDWYIFLYNYLPYFAFFLLAILFFSRKKVLPLQILSPVIYGGFSIYSIIMTLSNGRSIPYAGVIDVLMAIMVALAAFSIDGSGARKKTVQPNSGFAGTASVIDQLTRLKELKDKGILSDEEFTDKKAALLAKYHSNNE